MKEKWEKLQEEKEEKYKKAQEEAFQRDIEHLKEKNDKNGDHNIKAKVRHLSSNEVGSH